MAIQGKGKIEIKNSSKDIDFGYYDLDISIITDGGRVVTDKVYKAKFERNKWNKLTIKIEE